MNLYDWIAETKTWILICFFMKKLSKVKIDEKQDLNNNGVYIIDKKNEYPSVRTISKRISDSKYKYVHKNKKFDSDTSKQEGHQYCQNYLDGTQTTSNMFQLTEETCKCFMKELDKIKPIKTECVLYSHEIQFAGRADEIGNYDKQLCLIDYY